MTSLKQMDRAELQMFYEAALKEYESCKAKGLKAGYVPRQALKGPGGSLKRYA